MTNKISFLLFLCFISGSVALAALPEDALQDIQAFDLPSDDGTAIGLSWRVMPAEDLPEGSEYILFQGPEIHGPLKEVLRFPASSRFKSGAPEYFGHSAEMMKEHFVKIDAELDQKGPVQKYYQIALLTDSGEIRSPVVTALPRPNYFARHKLNNFLLMLFICGAVLWCIHRARRNPNLTIRKIQGLEAIDEAIGRATEMGKPILYTTGYSDMDRVSTIASVGILAHVAQKAAEYGTRLIVPCKWSITMAACQEVVREAYLNAGRPDAYNPNDIFYVAGEQFSWTAAVEGILAREKPAANFFLGTFAAEALILAETGAWTGAIQISGTDSSFQIPFFVVACDYCLIGEELYAASAYLSREPRLLGSLKGQDMGKLILLFALIAGNILLWMQGILPGGIAQALKHFFTPL